PYGQTRYHAYRGELDLALRLDEDLLRLSRERNDSAGLVLSYGSYGRTLWFLGRFAASRLYLEQAVASFHPTSPPSLLDQIGIYPRVVSQRFLGLLLFCLGFPDQALAQSSTAITEAEKLAHPTSLAGTLPLGTHLLALTGNNTVLAEWAEKLGEVTT